jgi:hypothetical protein
VVPSASLILIENMPADLINETNKTDLIVNWRKMFESFR